MLALPGDKYYEQVHGAPMDSPISPSLQTCSGKSLKSAISSTSHPLLWLRFVDDTFIIQQAEHTKQLFQHINSQDPHIQFTTEEPNQDGSLLFLNTLGSPGPYNTITTTVYRKPTHSNEYLHRTVIIPYLPRTAYSTL